MNQSKYLYCAFSQQSEIMSELQVALFVFWPEGGAARYSDSISCRSASSSFSDSPHQHGAQLRPSKNDLRFLNVSRLLVDMLFPPTSCWLCSGLNHSEYLQQKLIGSDPQKLFPSQNQKIVGT